MTSITIIGPCYNESDNIDEFVSRIKNILEKLNLEYEILLVDDGSKDKTWQKILEHSKKNIYYLSNVSDGTHILEFLLEFCIKYNLQSSLIVWSIYKMMLFLKGEYFMESLVFCINTIVNEKSTCITQKYHNGKIDSKRYLYDKKTFPLFLLYYSIVEEDLVRKNNISKYIYHNMHSMLKFSKNKLDKLRVYDSQILKGRLWLNNYIKSLSDKQLNSELIIMLELARGALKVSQKNDAKIIWHNLNIYLEKK